MNIVIGLLCVSTAVNVYLYIKYKREVTKSIDANIKYKAVLECLKQMLSIKRS